MKGDMDKEIIKGALDAIMSGDLEDRLKKKKKKNKEGLKIVEINVHELKPKSEVMEDDDDEDDTSPMLMDLKSRLRKKKK